MEKLPLPADFRDFLQLLNLAQVEYLLVGGYAVGYYGYPRATGDMDVWVAATPENAAKLVDVLCHFGFSPESVKPELFTTPGQIIRMGVPPVCIDILTTASGVEFDDCYSRRNIQTIDGMAANIIPFEDLKRNKKASGRPKDPTICRICPNEACLTNYAM